MFRLFIFKNFPHQYQHIIEVLVIHLFLAMLAAGCSLKIPQDANKHIIMINGRGKAVNIEGEKQCPNDGPCVGVHNQFIRSFKDYEEITSEAYKEHVDEVIQGVMLSASNSEKNKSQASEKYKSCNKRKVLIFIHGGLNTQTGTLIRAGELYDKICEGGYYPIFINWQSSLFSSYRDHLLFVRQGKWRNFGFFEAPFFLVSDLLRGIARAPLTWGYMFKNDIETLIKQSEDEFHAAKAFDEWKSAYLDDLRQHDQHLKSIAISGGDDKDDKRRDWEIGLSFLQYIVTLPTKLLIAPLLDSFGKSSWDIMLRRTHTLFHKEGEFADGGKIINAPAVGEGGLSIFISELQKAVNNSDQEWEITLVGHSMGTIVINEILRGFDDFHFQNIVYMASATTIRDYENSVFPYLKNSKHDQTQFYHLVLHREAEARERWEGFTVFVDLPPRGSLLVWIDDFLSKPKTALDRTLGRWNNLLVSLRNTPKPLRKRVHVRGFRVGKAVQNSDPQEHGDFTVKPFWEESFWKPSEHP